jgi:hypothetical protein
MTVLYAQIRVFTNTLLVFEFYRAKLSLKRWMLTNERVKKEKKVAIKKGLVGVSCVQKSCPRPPVV